ncbi:unnamed protein product, partial [Didymodactylos carnosus]
MALKRGVVLNNHNCCASIVVNQTTSAVLVERGNHSHEEVKVEHPLVRDLKRKVGDDISPIPHQYEGAIHEMVSQTTKTTADCALVPKYESVRSSLYRARWRQLQTYRPTKEDFMIPDNLQKTLDGQRFRAFDVDIGSGMLGFCSHEGLFRLSI